jgi:predicted transcriptional regulator
MSPATLAERRPLVPPPDGDEKRDEILTCRRALLRLLTRRPNEIVTQADVCDEIGLHVGRGAIGNAAVRLRRDLAIEGVPGPGGGYVLLMPVPTLGLQRCANCASRTVFSECPRARRDEVNLNCKCWGWSHA